MHDYSWIGPEEYRWLVKRYERAVKDGEVEFHVPTPYGPWLCLTSFCKYLLEFLRPKFEPQHGKAVQR